MSGHSKWAQIKHQKTTTDAKRGQLFSKLSKAITLISRAGGADLGANAKLREMVAKAKEANMPSDTIERAIKKGANPAAAGKKLESFLYEAYGPGGAALLIEGTTDSRNRSSAKIKHLLAQHEAKWAEPGSVRWAFIHTKEGWEAQEHSIVSLNEGDQKKFDALREALKNNDDVEEVYFNVKFLNEKL